MSAWTYRSLDGKAAQKIVPPCPRIPRWKGPSAESGEKHEPASDIAIAVLESLKALDPTGRLEKRTWFSTTGMSAITAPFVVLAVCPTVLDLDGWALR